VGAILDAEFPTEPWTQEPKMPAGESYPHDLLMPPFLLMSFLSRFALGAVDVDDKKSESEPVAAAKFVRGFA